MVFSTWNLQKEALGLFGGTGIGIVFCLLDELQVGSEEVPSDDGRQDISNGHDNGKGPVIQCSVGFSLISFLALGERDNGAFWANFTVISWFES